MVCSLYSYCSNNSSLHKVVAMNVPTSTTDGTTTTTTTTTTTSAQNALNEELHQKNNNAFAAISEEIEGKKGLFVFR